MQLFQRAEYKVDNQVIERVENPGDATLITSLVDYPADYVEAMGDTLMIAKDTGANLTAATNTGFVARKKYHNFDVCIPLSHIFRFTKDVRKAFYGMTHSVELVRKTGPNDALLRAADVDAGKVKFTSMSLWMPRVTPSDKANAKLLKFMQSKQTIQAPFEQIKYFDKAFDDMRDITWNISDFTPTDRPRHVFIAFRLRAAENNQEQNNAVFSPCALTDISLEVNGEIVPRAPYSIDFASGKVARPFQDLVGYRGVEHMYDSGMLINKQDFLNRYPIYHFDLENMPERLNNSPSTVTLRARLNAGGNYRVLATVLADKKLSFTADGKKMNVSLN